MADDLLPLLGIGGEEDRSDSEEDDDEQEPKLPLLEVKDQPVPWPDPQRRKCKKPFLISYDASLPGTHSYLGDDLEELRGRTIHDADSLLDLPVLSLPGVVLVPGQTVPLTLFQPQTVNMIRNVLDKDKTFGLVTARYDEADFSQTLASIGTTAEIYSVKDDMDERSGISTLRVKAKGRQRFEICETRRQITGILMAKVRILPERILPSCLEGATPRSHCKFKCCVGSDDPHVNTAVDRQGNVLASVRILRNRKIDQFRAAYLTWWPPWVYKMYDERLLMRRIQEELQSWNDSLKVENMPENATDFSFWVAQNLPVDDSMRLHLLSLDCAVQRLRCELSIMQKCTVLRCRECDLEIANKKDVFSMAVEGPLGAYVNPGGHVHETLTIFKTQSLRLIGRSSSEHSWFPGYSWTIAQCKECSSHMGWKFTASNKKLSPQKFWGLCRASLIPGLKNTDGDDPKDEWLPTI